MDTKSRILVTVGFICIIASAVYMYDRYVINDSFEIYQNDDGVPEVLEE